MGANHVGGITHQIGPTRSSCSRSQAAGLGNCNMYSTVWPVQPTSIGTAPMHSMEPSKERLGRECFIIFQCNTKNSSYLLSGSFFLLCTYIIFWVHTHIYIYTYVYIVSRWWSQTWANHLVCMSIKSTASKLLNIPESSKNMSARCESVQIQDLNKIIAKTKVYKA